MKRPHRRSRCCLALLALCCAAGARADVLVGPKGERLPGQLIEQKDGTIIFWSDFVGRIEVDAAVAHVEADPVAPTGAAASPGGPAVAAATPAPDVPRWSADVGVKINLDRGSLKTSEDRFDARVEFDRNTGAGVLHASLGYRYKRTDGELRDDDLSASLGYEQFVSERRFHAARMLVTTELSDSGYDATRMVAVASGWRLWETPAHYLRIGPAIGYLAVDRGEENFTGPAFGLYARAMTPLPWDTRLTGEFYLLESGSDGRFAAAEVRLRRSLGERLYMALGWNYVWSNFEIEPGVKSEWRWDIGWRFGPPETTR